MPIEQKPCDPRGRPHAPAGSALWTRCCWNSCNCRSPCLSWSDRRSSVAASCDWPPPPGCWRRGAPRCRHPGSHLGRKAAEVTPISASPAVSQWPLGLAAWAPSLSTTGNDFLPLTVKLYLLPKVAVPEPFPTPKENVSDQNPQSGLPELPRCPLWGRTSPRAPPLALWNVFGRPGQSQSTLSPWEVSKECLLREPLLSEFWSLLPRGTMGTATSGEAVT